MERIKKDLGIIFIINFVLLGLFFLQDNWIKVSRYEILSGNLLGNSNNYKVLQVSDLNSKEFGEGRFLLLNKIREINPDLIVITGDMLQSTNEDGKSYLKFAEGLVDEYKIAYYAGENPKQSVQGLKGYIDKLNKIGVKVSDNDKIEIRKNQNINLYDLLNPLKNYMVKDSARYADEIVTRLFKRPEITVITYENS